MPDRSKSDQLEEKFYRSMRRDRVGLTVSMGVFGVIAVWYTLRAIDGFVFGVSTRWIAAGNLLAGISSAYAVGFFYVLRKRMRKTEQIHRDLDRRAAELAERYPDVYGR